MAAAKMAASAGPSPLSPSFLFLPFFSLSAAAASLALVPGGASPRAGGRLAPGDLSGCPALLERGRGHQAAGGGSFSGSCSTATRRKIALFRPFNAAYGVVLVRDQRLGGTDVLVMAVILCVGAVPVLQSVRSGTFAPLRRCCRWCQQLRAGSGSPGAARSLLAARKLHRPEHSTLRFPASGCAGPGGGRSRAWAGPAGS